VGFFHFHCLRYLHGIIADFFHGLIFDMQQHKSSKKMEKNQYSSKVFARLPVKPIDGNNNAMFNQHKGACGVTGSCKRLFKDISALLRNQ